MRQTKIVLRIGAGYAERTLRSREDDGTIKVLEHIVKGGGGIRHRIRTVGDDESVVVGTQIVDLACKLLPIRGYDIARVEGEIVTYFDLIPLRAHRCAQFFPHEDGAQSVFSAA